MWLMMLVCSESIACAYAVDYVVHFDRRLKETAEVDRSEHTDKVVLTLPYPTGFSCRTILEDGFFVAVIIQ